MRRVEPCGGERKGTEGARGTEGNGSEVREVGEGADEGIEGTKRGEWTAGEGGGKLRERDEGAGRKILT